MALCIDVSGIFVKFFHLIVVGQFFFSMYYDFNYIVVPKDTTHVMTRPGFGGRLRFLTYWCLVSTTTSRTKERKKKLIKKNIIKISNKITKIPFFTRIHSGWHCPSEKFILLFVKQIKKVVT